MSNSIFHEASVVKPTPVTVSSSTVSKVTRSPCWSIIGLSLPLAGLPSGLRWKKMLKNAVKRCHATPHVKLMPTKTRKTMPESSLIRAMTLTSTGEAGNRFARWIVRKSAHREPPPKVAIFEALTSNMPSPESSTTASMT